MHFDILVEDLSGERLLELVVPRILGSQGQPHTYEIHSYSGVGHIPHDLRRDSDPRKRVLLNQLPRLLRGFANSRQGISSAVVVVVDSDNRPCHTFKQELVDLHRGLQPRPRALFRLAIEEMEAWLLGDRDALLAGFPAARPKVLDGYVQDSICGTWETLADAIYPGGQKPLKKLGYPTVGRLKSEWATSIGRHLDPARNLSPSFRAFRDGLLKLAGE